MDFTADTGLTFCLRPLEGEIIGKTGFHLCIPILFYDFLSGVPILFLKGFKGFLLVSFSFKAFKRYLSFR